MSAVPSSSPPLPLRNLRLFLASPGGVDQERAATKRVADQLNVPFGRVGWHVEVLRWEDRGPASGRAQADINPDVDRCHVFLGIVWDRWGTPTGDHTSGFAEEWTRARDRWRETRAPELWIFLKEVDPEREAAPDDQLVQVLAFRSEIEAEELAFYKTFRSPADFEVALRNRLLDELLKRSGVGREALGAIPVDWSAALEHEPVALLRDGQERDRLATEQTQTDPARAATILAELGEELEASGFSDLADSYRERAAGALEAAGRDDDALALRRSLLIKAVERGWPVDVEFAARGLSERLAPEQQWEAEAWLACVDWPLNPAAAAQTLQHALDSPTASPVPELATRLWRRTLWELWLASGEAPKVLADSSPIALPDDEDLALLRADALAATDDPAAGAAWQVLRDSALGTADDDPARAARIWARWACHLVSRARITEAEEAFTRASILWARGEGYEEESAECFFSAQAAGRLGGEFIPRGWSWRARAAAQRGAGRGPSALADSRERAGIAAHLDGQHKDARRLLALGIAIHRRAGHLRGTLALTETLARVDRDGGNTIDAVLGLCACAQGKEAAAAAAGAGGRELIDRLPAGARDWETRATCAVLAHIGRQARPARAAELLPPVLDLSRRPPRPLANAETEAAEALAELAVALDPADLQPAVDRLRELLADDHYQLHRAAAGGLQMLTDLGRIDGADALVAYFARNPQDSGVSTGWVADHLDTPARAGIVRQRALTGDPFAILALHIAELVAGDGEVERGCARYCAGIVAADLGRVPPGPESEGGVWGLVATDLMGAVAAACPDEAIRRQVAETLELYARETMWPIINRAKALRGLAEVGVTFDPRPDVDQLRALVEPAPDDIPEDPYGMLRAFSADGDLEAAALEAAVTLCNNSPLPSWLKDAAVLARSAPLALVRAAAWAAAATHGDLPVDGAQLLALGDDNAQVRGAALWCWLRRRPKQLPPKRHLDRLARDPFVHVRMTLVDVLAHVPGASTTTAAEALRADPDAYVRGTAAARLV